MISLAVLALAASHAAVGPVPITSQVTASDPNGGYAVVDNHRDVPINVFAETDWGEVDLGTVAPRSGRAFALAPAIVSQHMVDFRVVPRDECIGDSGMITLHPDTAIRLIVPPRWGPADHDKFDPTNNG